MHEDEEEEDSCTGAQSTQQHGDFYVNEQHHVLHKSVGLLRAVALVTGAVIGAGIFTTPKNVLAHAGSPGMALAVWFGCGIFTLLGVLCYAELGLMVPKSGGQYQYLRETLNFATEELKNPKKNLPRALLISMCLVTALFVLTNLAYMLVLPQQELLDTGVVAMAFARQTMGAFAAVMPLLVILSLMGSLNGNIFMGGRVYFAGARDGHQLPELLAMVSVGRITPLPALLLNGMMASLMILFSVGDIDYLHRSYGCWRWIMVAGGAICQIYLRIKRPDLPRPFKVPMMVPVLFLLVCGYLILVPVILEPQLLVVGICIHLLGIPVYYATVIGRGRLFLQGATRKWTLLLQKVLLVALTDSKMPGLKRHRHKKS
ncbi:PREDICTED: large neutral amino acids transporter small subunit 2-like isoform X3 [Priapulus caudatus]|uniref:Large neutral amino acids transporter small subunit 2-like isoform X3 n=1 Tax=Priapulus caudatus TaxID=37621 RepID=A0ABM1EJ22_PRICU|nr:PREDICTED: large neutral amino acids transporter small subunit 2-like isoform X3 [Priapulus caudatus]